MNRFPLAERRPPRINWPTGKFTMANTGLLSLRCDFSVAKDIEFLTLLQIDLIGIDRRNQMICSARLNDLPVGREIAAFVGQRPESSYGPDYVDLWNLYHHVRTNRPQSILELGSGLSTLVMGYALMENGAGSLCSLEPDEEWARSTENSLPDCLRGHCAVIHSRGAACEVGGQATKCFAEKPLESPGMIYVDGASEGACWKGAEDVMQLESQLVPGTTVFIDGRAKALKLFHEGHFARNWRMRTNMILLEISPADVSDTLLGLDQFANSYLVLDE